jgi:hypothetical protein
VVVRVEVVEDWATASNWEWSGVGCKVGLMVAVRCRLAFLAFSGLRGRDGKATMCWNAVAKSFFMVKHTWM